MNKHNPLAKAVRTALIASAAIAVAIPTAYAEEAEEGENRVTITGSRIKRIEVEGANPVTVITREDILRSGVTNIGELLQRLPEITGSPLNTSVNNGGNGGVFVDIRGLGRTLTLVNGRRTPDGGDFQTIPAAMIERVEILKDGASAIYGSDAMAGVVNIITRRDFEGLQFQAQYATSQEVESGAGDLKQFSMVMGATGDKGHFVVGIDWNEQEKILQSDLSWAFVQDSIFLIPQADGSFEGVGFGSSRIPGGNFNLGSGAGDCGSVIFEDGNNMPGLPANYRCYNGTQTDPNNDSYNYAPVNFLQTPYERTNIFVEADYQVNSDTRFFTEIRMNKRTSEQKLAPMPYDTNFDPSWNEVGGAAISADNFYNPFGEDVNRARRRIVEDDRRFTQDITQYQYVFGVEGVLLDAWDYEISYNKGNRQRTDIDSGQWVGSRIGNALGPSYYDAATDTVVCGTVANPIDAGNCVSLNLFGGPGNITQEMLDYVGTDLVDYFSTDLEILNATISGEIMELPAGAWGIAVGYEHRTLATSFTPDSGKAFGLVTGNTGAGVGGSYTNSSYFVESAIPLLSDIPAVQSLELNLGVRIDDYSLGFDNTSSQIGIRWTVTDDLLLRATLGDSFRAPGIGELFSPSGDGFPALQDPCNDTNFGALSAEGQANCIADGVPAGGYFQTDTQLRARSGGNPQLKPESGESLTVGMAWSPSFLDGFNMTLDYWEIEIDEVISSLSAATILGNCVNIGASCDKTTRRADGSIDFIESNTTNLGGRDASGVDVNFKYGFDIEMGHIQIGLLYAHLLERTEYEFDGTRNPWELEGSFDDLTVGGAFPVNKASFSVDWTHGDWSASYSMDYIDAVAANYAFLGFAGHTPGQPLTNTVTGELILDANGNAQQPRVQHVPFQMYHDITGTYSFDGAKITFGLTNLTNEAPPFIDSAFNASTDPGTYRLYGRSWFLRTTYDF